MNKSRQFLLQNITQIHSFLFVCFFSCFFFLVVVCLFFFRLLVAERVWCFRVLFADTHSCFTHFEDKLAHTLTFILYPTKCLGFTLNSIILLFFFFLIFYSFRKGVSACYYNLLTGQFVPCPRLRLINWVWTV